MWRLLGIVLVLLIAAFCGAQEAGFAQRVVGRVTRQTPDGTVVPLRDYDSVSINDVLVAPHNASAEIILYFNGSRTMLQSAGKCKVTKASLKVLSGKLVKLKPIDKQYLRAIQGRDADGSLAGLVVRGDSDPDLSPGETVRNSSVTLRWPAVTGATAIDVRVTDEDNEVVHKVLPGSATRMALDPRVTKPGRKLQWTLTTLDGSDELASRRAEFYVITPEQEASLALLEKSAARDASLLGVLAMAYQRLELYSQANAIWQRLKPAK